jgi:hypothetical protein
MGFKVRMEVLEDEQATWCEIAGVKTLFVDLSQTAAEQLQQIEESLSALAAQTAAPVTGIESIQDAGVSDPKAQTAGSLDGDLANRAA